MHRHELDQMMLKTLDQPDNGFTDSVLRALPSPRLRLFNRAQATIWSVAGLVIVGLVFLGAREQAQTYWTLSGMLVLGLLAVVITFTHMDSELA